MELMEKVAKQIGKPILVNIHKEIRRVLKPEVLVILINEV